MRECTRCKLSRHEDEFYKTGDYRRKYCKYCEHKAKTVLARKRKAEVVKRMGGKCIKCGYNKSPYALELHHTSVKVFEPSTIIRQGSREVADSEISGCVLLCANCHREETFGSL